MLDEEVGRLRVITILSGSYTFMIRGMPGAGTCRSDHYPAHRKLIGDAGRVDRPISSVSGLRLVAACSDRNVADGVGPTPLPFQSGYFDSSNACAPSLRPRSAATNAIIDQASHAALQRSVCAHFGDCLK